MPSNNLEPIESGFGEDKIIVYFRRIWVEEEDAFNERFAEIVDLPDVKKREFEIMRDMLGDFSVAVPNRYTKVEGQAQTVPVNDKTNPKEAVDEYFAVRTIEKDRVLRELFWTFKRAQLPDTRFLPPSAL